ncbi:anti-sigma factor family protein [Ruania halotolerans]|uniref:anti-sigma factor family protein n=1 Tax=Ruania halotolerans TaxID=2897773 RepID=UPI001E5306B5|nr:zf-HC2 domain-containing protein [Ruania halotolerans]UFU05583.1 zf-HC2 domain-containing protein [Ruania halotolerans]
MSHLGPLVSPFVDGQLSPARMAKVEQHLVECPACRSRVDAERSCRDAARAARAVPVNPDLTEKLLALSIPGATAGPLRTGPGEVERAVRGTRVRVISGALASAGVFAIALFVLGGQQRQVDDLTAMVPTFKDPAALTTMPVLGNVSPAGHSSPTTGGEEISGTVLEWMTASGWSAPSDLPAGMRVENVSVADNADAGGQVLRLDLVDGATVVHVMEQRGVLDTSMVAALEPVQVGPHEVYLVAENWWIVQCGGSVVAVSSGEDPTAAHEVIMRMSEADDSGVVDRLANGLHVLLAGS